MNLLLPVAGGSTRFPNMKPKWLLTNPNGNLMIIEAIKGLDLKKYNKIYIIALDEHLQEFKFKSGIKRQFMQMDCGDKLEFVININIPSLIPFKLTATLLINSCGIISSVVNLFKILKIT